MVVQCTFFITLTFVLLINQPKYVSIFMSYVNFWQVLYKKSNTTPNLPPEYLFFAVLYCDPYVMIAVEGLTFKISTVSIVVHNILFCVLITFIFLNFVNFSSMDCVLIVQLIFLSHSLIVP